MPYHDPMTNKTFGIATVTFLVVLTLQIAFYGGLIWLGATIIKSVFL